MCLPFILTRGLLWFWPEQSRINGRDTRVPEGLQCKQFELANTPMKSELYVGLDVDKEWIVITVAEWGRNGGVQDLGAISNDLHALEKLLARLRKRYGPDVIIRACYEAGPCGFTIARRLRQLGVECAVVAPSLTPTRAGDRLKTDKRDARKLARLLRAGELTEIYIPEPTDEALRDLCRARSDAVDDRSRDCGIIGSKRFCCGTGIVTRRASVVNIKSCFIESNLRIVTASGRLQRLVRCSALRTRMRTWASPRCG